MSDWTDERVVRLKIYLAQGLSMAQIARRLGHTTRNAVIGKIARLGLSSHHANCKTLHRSDQQRARIMKRKAKNSAPSSYPMRLPSEPLPPASEYDVARKSLDQLRDADCRFPVGDPRDIGFGFCALSKVEGLPYCVMHSRRAFPGFAARFTPVRFEFDQTEAQPAADAGAVTKAETV